MPKSQFLFPLLATKQRRMSQKTVRQLKTETPPFVSTFIASRLFFERSVWSPLPYALLNMSWKRNTAWDHTKRMIRKAKHENRKKKTMKSRGSQPENLFSSSITRQWYKSFVIHLITLCYASVISAVSLWLHLPSRVSRVLLRGSAWIWIISFELLEVPFSIFSETRLFWVIFLAERVLGCVLR